MDRTFRHESPDVAWFKLATIQTSPLPALLLFHNSTYYLGIFYGIRVESQHIEAESGGGQD
jgi:hypothetical protein